MYKVLLRESILERVQASSRGGDPQRTQNAESCHSAVPQKRSRACDRHSRINTSHSVRTDDEIDLVLDRTDTQPWKIHKRWHMVWWEAAEPDRWYGFLYAFVNAFFDRYWILCQEVIFVDIFCTILWSKNNESANVVSNPMFCEAMFSFSIDFVSFIVSSKWSLEHAWSMMDAALSGRPTNPLHVIQLVLIE